MSFANAYAKFRGGRGFLITLTCVVSFWLTWNLLPFTPHFDDPGMGRLNVFLSVEASLSVALLIMANEKQELAQRKQLEYMLHIMEAIHAQLMEKNQAVVVAIKTPAPADTGDDPANHAGLDPGAHVA